MSKIYRFEQGTAQWYACRMGKPTASQFHRIMTPVTMKASSQAPAYMYRLIAERLLLESMDEQLRVEWVERGKELEPHAVTHFEFTNEIELEPVGFVTTDDDKLGCSPDRLVKNKAEAVEIKCPAPWVQIGYLLDGPGTDYAPQVQGQLLVGEFERVHFYAYHDRMPAMHLVTYPDPVYQKALRRHLSDFLEQMDEALARAKALGAYVANPGFQTPLDETVPPREPLTIVVPE